MIDLFQSLEKYYSCTKEDFLKSNYEIVTYRENTSGSKTEKDFADTLKAFLSP
jgi:hypothetical protein